MISRSSTVSLGKDAYSKALVAHMQKAINPQEVPPKPKHVRAIILGTHQHRTSDFLYSATCELQVLTIQVACWKYLIVVHKVLRNGYREAIRYAPRKIATFEEIKRTWTAFPGQYSTIIGQLCCVIIKKFGFHRTYSNIPGDFEISQQAIMSSIGRSPDNLMSFALALMDYLEVILNFQAVVFTEVESSPSTTSISSNCRLAALTQCVRDSASLYDMALKAIIKLHSLKPAETLELLRTRFSRLYHMLERFFARANSYAYIRDFLRIPLLPSSPPDFLDSVSGVQSIEVVEKLDEEGIGQLVDLSASESLAYANEGCRTGDIDAIVGGPVQSRSSSSVTSPQREHMLEIEFLRSEIQRMEIEKASTQEQLLDRIRLLEDEIKALVQVKARQDEQLTMLVDQVKNQMAAAAASEEKFMKISGAYGKLRAEHVSTLKEVEASCQNGVDAKQRLAALELERVSWEEKLRALEGQLAESRLTLQIAETRKPDFSSQLKSACQVAEQEMRDLLLKTACLKAKQDASAIESLMEDPEFVQCRSCADVVNTFAKSATSKVIHLKGIVSDADVKNSTTLPLDVAHLSSYLNATLLHAKSIANSAADIVRSDELLALCKRCHNDSFDIYSHLASTNFEAWRNLVVLGHVESLLTALARIQVLAEEMRPNIKDVNEEDLSLVLEQEMQSTTELIARAEARFKELLEQSKTSMTGIQLEVNNKILDSCTRLMSAISILVARACDLQIEIVNEGRGTATVKEFYKRHNRWTEGLFSAAKSVGAGANLLVETADAIVTNKGGQLERLIVAALEISGSTTQLVVASRVKASKGSRCLSSLESAAKAVSSVTGEVVAGVQNASVIKEQTQNMDFAKLSYTQAHKIEVDRQVRILELEAQLAAGRQRLAEIRRFNYSNASEFEQKS
ncbi:huntingtin interacting protein 1 [Echinococcus multilocularis]|uniref:Huntingtin interacting protein 1 n=1 Tax=Echinococcus multilocularis TaxID=6211 RepID=A0A068Y8Z2_ECHMU|nr:huntingtin interacting protein 1 [Echinococcus multilocularis]